MSKHRTLEEAAKELNARMTELGRLIYDGIMNPLVRVVLKMGRIWRKWRVSHHRKDI